MDAKSDNIEIMMNDKANEIIEELFDSFRNRYQNNLESIKGSELVFDYRKINLNHSGSYTDSPNWMKNKKATTNPINKKDNNCFQYTVTVALNYEEMKKDTQRITKIKPLMSKYH